MLPIKKLFKNKRLLAVIGGAAALLLIVSVVCLITPNKPSGLDNSSEPSASETGQSIVIETPESTASSDTTNSVTAGKIVDDGSGLKPDESVSDSATEKNTGEKAQKTASPKKEADPPKDSGKGSNGGIQIGGGESTSKYSCGSPKHHCDGPETHAFILNLELEGCPYCGSHSCPSFYGIDKWGNAGYFPKLCPKYDITKDPVYYCQDCGKKCGDGTNGTCVRFVKACKCSNCGEYVEEGTCHTCK